MHVRVWRVSINISYNRNLDSNTSGYNVYNTGLERK